ncbi:MAG TPA: hypothetical protein VGY97_05865 [Solirubrobacteraceae bacterium]|jgi:hypothetical protein|nr:hypothetical protein [Solirubrobacteraceae bacterium]
MSAQSEPQRYVRQVVLPSGRTIQVVYFGDAAGTSEPERTTHGDLHLCDLCDSNLVYPIDWEESGPNHWRVSLRCPNCEWTVTGVYEQEVVERFDCELDRGTEALMRDLQRLQRANMEDDVERFIEALNGDHVLPADF